MPNAPVPIAVDVSELSSAPQSAQSSQPTLTDFMSAPDAPKAIAVDATELSQTPNLQDFLNAPEQSQPAASAQSQPEQPLFQKHPANLEYKNIRERESSDKIAARQSAAKDVSRGTEIVGEALGAVGGAAELFMPRVALTAAGSTAEIAKDVAGNTVIKSVPNMVQTTGKSLAQQGVSKIVDTAGTVVKWAKENPLSAAGIESVARDLGIDPFQLAHKLIKYGMGLVDKTD